MTDLEFDIIDRYDITDHETKICFTYNNVKGYLTEGIFDGKYEYELLYEDVDIKWYVDIEDRYDYEIEYNTFDEEKYIEFLYKFMKFFNLAVPI